MIRFPAEDCREYDSFKYTSSLQLRTAEEMNDTYKTKLKLDKEVGGSILRMKWTCNLDLHTLLHASLHTLIHDLLHTLLQTILHTLLHTPMPGL